MTKQNVLTRKGFVDQISMSSYLLTGFQVYLWFRLSFPTANVSPVLYKKKTISVHFAAIKILRQLRKVLQRVQKVLAKVNFLKGHGWSAMLCSYTSNKWKPALIRATVEDYRKNFTVIKITKCPEFPLDCISSFAMFRYSALLRVFDWHIAKPDYQEILSTAAVSSKLCKRKNFSQRRGKFKQISWNPESSTSGRSCLN